MSVRRVLVDQLPSPVRARYRRVRLLARYEHRRIAYALRERRLPRVRGLLLTYPELPTAFHMLHKAAAHLGYRLTDDPTVPADAAVRFMDRTTWEPDEALRQVARRLPVPNLGCSDVSKSRVNEVFGAVFGYELGIDPRRHRGPAVAKSEENATHDGRLVSCPTEPEPGISYQRFVDATVPGGRHVECLRTPIVGDAIPLVYHKLRPFDGRFADATDHVRIRETDEVYTPQEVERLLAFARGLHLDVGEIDVLRDRVDGRVYVVDANHTPWGPPLSLPPAQTTEAIRRLAPHYLQVIESAARRRPPNGSRQTAA